MVQKDLEKVASIIKNSKHTTAFTGAGISVESGIPPFRGASGLWNKYDPKVLSLTYFYSDPENAWIHIREIFYDFFGKAKPNNAHLNLAKLEHSGIVKAVITQNIDNLHQEAGSKNVIEFHGTAKTLICTRCKTTYNANSIALEMLPPLCPKCNKVLKPNFVFFEEGIPEEAYNKSLNQALAADVFLVIGTTGEVMPASFIPREAKSNGAIIIEINTEPSYYTNTITNIFLKGKAGEILPQLIALIL